MDMMGRFPSVLSISDFQGLEDVGVSTVEFSALAHLDLDWKIIYDKLDEVLRNTDLKLLCPFWRTSPKDVSWLDAKGIEIDYGNPAVGKSIDETTLRFLDGLGNNRDRVQVNYAPGLSGGEVDWMRYEYRLNPGQTGAHNRVGEVPPVSDERVAEFIVDRQKILSAQYNEVWTSFVTTQREPSHPRWMIIENALYDAYPIDEYEHYRIQHWYFDNLNNDLQRGLVRKNSRSKYFVGSNFVRGLETNYAAGMEQGVWGFITAPIHAHSKKTALEEGMLNTIRIAITGLNNEN
jgi:hypothetical protein